MEIEVWSIGKTKFTADSEFQEPMIREAVDTRGDVASTVLEYTDSDRNDITYDEYARVTGDVPGLVLFEGWLTGDRDAPPPVGALAAEENEPPQTVATTLTKAVERLGIDRARAMADLQKIINQSGGPLAVEDIAYAALEALRDNTGGTIPPPKPAPESATATETSLRLALAFIEQVRDGAYGDLATADAEQALYEIGMP